MLRSIEELEKHLAAAKEALRVSQERSAAGQLALELMHEVKNPLETLGHLTYLALAEPNFEQVKAYLRQAEEQITTLGQIASQTLGFARESSAQQVVNAASLVEAALRIHQRAIDRKKIKLLVDPFEYQPIKVYPGQILQVLSNIIGNAIDALRERGHLRVATRRRGDNVEIIVGDDGVGIAQEHAKKVFEAFFSTKETNGTGLGLSLSKKLVERHRGRIRMHSSCGPHRTGTIFRVCLPG